MQYLCTLINLIIHIIYIHFQERSKNKEKTVYIGTQFLNLFTMQKLRNCCINLHILKYVTCHLACQNQITLNN